MSELVERKDLIIRIGVHLQDAVLKIIEKQKIKTLEQARDRFQKALNLTFKRGEDIRKEGEEVLYIVLKLRDFYSDFRIHNPAHFYDACVMVINHILITNSESNGVRPIYLKDDLEDSELRDDMDLDLLGVGSPEIEEFMVKEGLVVYKE